MKERTYDKKDKYADKGEKADKYGDRYSERYSEDMEEIEGAEGKRGRKFSGGNKKRSCRFMAGEEDVANLNYKNPRFLANFMTEHGKIVPRRVTGNCALIQRKLAQEIKRARTLALLGYISVGPNNG